MNSGRGRKMVTVVRPSKMVELVNYWGSTNESNSEGSHSHVEYIISKDEGDGRVGAARTLDDLHNKLPRIQELPIPEDFSQDCDEERKYEHNAQITEQCAEPSHVLHKPAVPEKIAIESERELSPNEEGHKGRWKKKKKRRHRYRELVAYAQTARNQTYICKPETGCQGRGIYITKHITEIKPRDKIVCQIYISRPFLVDGFKFDLRLYVLITSCDPLRIYVYNEGLVRLATSRYQEPTVTNTSNAFMHLTNYAVNKHSRTYIVDDEAGSKRKISTLTNWLLKKDYDVQEMWSNIDDVIVKTLVAAHPVLKHSYHACFPAHDFTYACFELLGFDILLDYRLKPYLLEVNHSPSFHIDTQIDCDVKESLLKDTFIILNLKQSDKRKVLEEDRRRVRERLLQGINHKEIEQRNNAAATSGSSLQDHWKGHVAWEESHLGNYHCVYPCLGYDKYEQFFHQNQGSLFQDTAASRARDEYARMQREELQMKAKAGCRKAGHKNKNADKLQPESPLSRESKTAPAIKKRYMLPKRVAEKKQSFLNSFEPGQIVECEERTRNIRMAERGFLLKRLGIAGQIVNAMKKNGSLRLDREKQFNLYRKMHNSSHAIDEESSKLPSMFSNANKPHFPHRINRSNFVINPNPRLSITCNNAPIFKRPHVPHDTWLEGISKDDDVRFTKTHVARSITNTYKLQEMVRREQQHNS